MILFPTQGGDRVDRGPPALRSHSSDESGDFRSKEVFDLHIQEMLERGEASSSVVNTLNIFANQIRSLNGEESSMRREWRDENQQMKDKVDRLATEVATQADAGRMRMIVQRFAGEIIPDSKAIVRYADEQSEIVDQRINSLSDEVRKSIGEIEGGLSLLHQVIQDKRHAMFRSHAAFEDQTNTEIEKFEKRLSLAEKAVRPNTSSGAPTASGPDRAASSGTDVNVRELTTRVGVLQSEHDRHARWASQSIGDLQDKFRTLADRAPLPVLTPEPRSDREFIVADRPRDPGDPPDWRAAVEENNRRVQDLTRRVYRQARDYGAIFEDVGAVQREYSKAPAGCTSCKDSA